MKRVVVVSIVAFLSLAAGRIQVDPVQLGRALFLEQWEPSDGLGPLFNHTSCVGCHKLGGAGGAGPKEQNVQLFTDANQVTGVLHYFHTDNDQYMAWRNARVLSTSEIGTVLLDAFSAQSTEPKVATPGSLTERNTPALFGAGAIDQISSQAFVAAAARRYAAWPDVTGRIARDATGRIGRFGWKGDVATLETFVANACANELGLEVPGVAQPQFVRDEPVDDVALDLNGTQLAALTAFVASLPVPKRKPSERAARGERLFHWSGCGACHTESLGGVDGLYSDLLLHDLGPQLGAVGGYYGAPSNADVATVEGADAPAHRQEWRTPPLWGVADSAPYLHDGRAENLHLAIDAHGGEAFASRAAYTELKTRDKADLIFFLSSLVAPDGAS